MDLYEYQAKQLFAAHGVPIMPGEVADTPEEAKAIAARFGTVELNNSFYRLPDAAGRRSGPCGRPPRRSTLAARVASAPGNSSIWPNTAAPLAKSSAASCERRAANGIDSPPPYLAHQRSADDERDRHAAAADDPQPRTDSTTNFNL